MRVPEAKSVAWSVAELTGAADSHVELDAMLDCRLHPRTARALRALRSAAAAQGLDVRVASAYRSFAQQLAIWNAKFAGQRPLLDRDCRPLDARCLSPGERVESILLWSALPGASRHHWGTDCDVYDAAALSAGERPQLLPAEYQPGGRFARLGAWLDRHSETYGFFRPYDRDRGGVQPEPWHLSFAPLATPALAALTISALRSAIENAEIAGRDQVLENIADLHARFVHAVAQPSARALAAEGVA